MMHALSLSMTTYHSPNHGTLVIIPNGTTVCLPDGSIALAYQDRRIGYEWDGTYVTVQTVHGIDRRDYGWRRDFLDVA